ncbi:MAG: formylglycine-generating enzyme family protein [Planctomycetes bacterium]|nr:formylglycine-generating enzyme family protein [Planctomycetota bacterium]
MHRRILQLVLLFAAILASSCDGCREEPPGGPDENSGPNAAQPIAPIPDLPLPEAFKRRDDPKFKVYVHEPTGLEFVQLPEGEYYIGVEQTDQIRTMHANAPRTKVRVSSFLICRTECTQRAFQKLMQYNPSQFVDPEKPVDSVSYNAAQDFCRASGLNLPSEAEWEYSARAGSGFDYPWGNAMDESHTWYCDNSGNETHAVGSKQPNAFGVFDMIGNVFEWCVDPYSQNAYQKFAGVDPVCVAESDTFILRGGSYASCAEYLKVYRRAANEPDVKSPGTGFRPAYSPIRIR